MINKVFYGLPEDTTHISKPYWAINRGGYFETNIHVFKYFMGELYVYHTNSDNEYPEWVIAKRQFTRIPDLINVTGE